MNKEMVKKWADALVSGEYKQTFGALKKNGCYCVLGVLCNLYKKETGKGDWNPLANYEVFLINDKCHTGTIPTEVQSWIGLSPSQLTAFAGANDCGNSFSSISSAIYKLLEEDEETNE